MSYDFLQNYNIPAIRQNPDNEYVSSSYSTIEGAYGTYTMQSTPAVNAAYYGYGDANTFNNCYQSASTNADNSGEYQNSERFIPPSKHSTSYKQYKPFKRKSNAISGGIPAKKEAPIAELTDDGKLTIFLGRDESYPDELNSLIHPLSCDLCNIKMNSRSIAKDHYESKVHDKRISSWLFKNFTEKGINPPEIKRFINQSPSGPNAFYCEACDLKLTSLTHANQHYVGKKHRLVIAQRAKPSGAGFYNSEGKWVRTGTKLTPKGGKDRRFEIGEAFKFAEIINSTGNSTIAENLAYAGTGSITRAADTTTSAGGEVKSSMIVSSNTSDDPALFCSFCKVSVTSAVQMTMHLSGSKHRKKLKLAGLEPTPICSSTDTQTGEVKSDTITDNVLLSAIKEEIKPDPTDLSMYRTPSGQYYCKTCNISMTHLPGLEQHLKGKRHLKKQTEEKAMASLALKKN